MKHKTIISVFLMLFLVLSFPAAIMAEDGTAGQDADNQKTNQDPMYQDYLNNHCFCQAPEANDDYVSVFVDIPAAGAEGVTEQMVANNLKISVITDQTVGPYETTPLIDETAEGEQFVFTTGRMPALKKGQIITIRYQFMSNEGRELAVKDEECPVGAAWTNKAFAKRALKVKIVPKTKAFVYSGKYNKPAVTATATYNGVKLPAEALSYTSAYTNSKSVGTAVVKITMTGDYTGSASAKYKIIPKGTKLAKVTPAKNGFTAKWKKQGTKMTASKRIDAYQIQYSTNSKFKSGNKIVTVKGYKTLSKKVAKLKAKKPYYVRVRTYLSVNGTKYYSKWSAAKKVKTK